jgi:hypothetical protein
MPLNKHNQRYMMRGLYAGQLEDVTLLKRGNDQSMGTVTSYLLFGIRWSMIHKTGELLGRDVQSSHPRRIHIPVAELDRVGVHFINPADRFIDEQGNTWMPEATTTLTLKLFMTHWCCDCLRVPNPS